MSKVFFGDSRNLLSKIKPLSVDVTITSPPYFDMKDYGYPNQIGYGQDYNTYLNDIKGVFKNVYEVTKDTGSLWVIIDTFRRDGEVIPLPFDFAKQASEIGWKLQDIIIWKKDKTAPWSRKGVTKKIFEYILFFSKSPNFKYFSDRVREVKYLKEWWIRYPERYSPNGKSLEEIWEFSIPVQGAWGNSYIRHFCPLPEDLVRQIILLTTDEGDVVFDPFSGSGTVPAQAAFMKRKYYGFELNKNYIEMFNTYLNDNLEKKLVAYNTAKLSLEQTSFRNKIIGLRILKYIRVLSNNLKINGINILKIYAEQTNQKLTHRHDVASARYIMLCERQHLENEIVDDIKKMIKIRPLSGFGIKAEFVFIYDYNDFVKLLFDKKNIFSYSMNNTHQYISKLTKEDQIDKGFIFSSIELNINEELYKGLK
ncbi:DNA-methyltransferase [Snodgrassella alvi]|nr:site-specific DNA-methyltransferase [Snodgrassella alvi]